MDSYTQLKIEDLQKLGGYTRSRDQKSKTLDQDSKVMQGRWSYQIMGQGLGMHFVDMEEVEGVSFSQEIPTGLSFNLLYKGQVDFTLGDHRYQLKAENEQPVCGCFALDKPEMLSRHTNKGMWVKKVNIFAEKKWLLERVRNEQDKLALQQVFQNHARLFQWQPSASEATEIVEQLVSQKQQPSFTENIQTESQILKLLSIFLQELFVYLEKIEKQELATDSTEHLFVKECKALFDASIEEDMSLTDIAQKLNTSVSTLQRKFKAVSGMTVAEYIRLQKLDKARRDLIEEGLSIGEVAYAAGYKHVANFVSAFRRQYSMSPAAYRKLHHR